MKRFFTPLAAAALAAVLVVSGAVAIVIADLRQHTENHAKIAIVQTQASHAEKLAVHDRAMIVAVCRAFNRRDRIEAYYDAVVTHVAKEYASTTNAYVRHVRPVFEQRDRVMTKIADDDCEALMNKAIATAAGPQRPPSPMPVVAGPPF